MWLKLTGLYSPTIEVPLVLIVSDDLCQSGLVTNRSPRWAPNVVVPLVYGSLGVLPGLTGRTACKQRTGGAKYN